MGLFDKLFKSTESNYTYSPQNEQEAWISIMYSCISIDGDVSDAETEKLCDLVVFKSLFNNHEIIDYYKNAILACKQVGNKQLIDSSVSKVSEENKATLFALIMELVLADGILDEKEKEIIEYLQKSMSLEPIIAEKVVEVMLIKNKGNVVLI